MLDAAARRNGLRLRGLLENSLPTRPGYQAAASETVEMASFRSISAANYRRSMQQRAARHPCSKGTKGAWLHGLLKGAPPSHPDYQSAASETVEMANFFGLFTAIEKPSGRELNTPHATKATKETHGCTAGQGMFIFMPRVAANNI